jgi:hypothetical protein
MDPGSVDLLVATSPSVVERCAFSALAVTEDFLATRALPAPSIGFPLMGSAVGKLSTFASADAICSGVRKYFAWHFRQAGEHSAIRRVVLIGFRPEHADPIRSALRKWQLVP